MEKSQREYYLREQMKAIQQELGEADERQAEVEEFRRKIKEAGLSGEVEKKALHEVKRLEKMPPLSAEAVVVRNYLDWLVSIPWNKRTDDGRDIEAARAVLDEDHYGLEKVKERILEYLAVRQLTDGMKGPILCLVGTAGRRKDVLGTFRGPGSGPQLRADLFGRRARRGRDSRPPAHVHRRHARPHHPGAAAGGVSAIPCFCWTKSTR